jgi:hypothetical protein
VSVKHNCCFPPPNEPLPDPEVFDVPAHACLQVAAPAKKKRKKESCHAGWWLK